MNPNSWIELNKEQKYDVRHDQVVAMRSALGISNPVT